MRSFRPSRRYRRPRLIGLCLGRGTCQGFSLRPRRRRSENTSRPSPLKWEGPSASRSFSRSHAEMADRAWFKPRLSPGREAYHAGSSDLLGMVHRPHERSSWKSYNIARLQTDMREQVMRSFFLPHGCAGGLQVRGLHSRHGVWNCPGFKTCGFDSRCDHHLDPWIKKRGPVDHSQCADWLWSFLYLSLNSLAIAAITI